MALALCFMPTAVAPGAWTGSTHPAKRVRAPIRQRRRPRCAARSVAVPSLSPKDVVHPYLAAPAASQYLVKVSRPRSPATDPCVPLPTQPPPKRKPHGYWNDLSHVEDELIIVNAVLGRRGKKTMPRLTELRALGRGDLIAALARHGGLRRVGEMLRWSHARTFAGTPSASQTTASSLAYGGVRRKFPRRPRAYWEDVERVDKALRAFVDEYAGTARRMPTQDELRKYGRADLLNAAARHGGLRAAAARIGLPCAGRVKNLRAQVRVGRADVEEDVMRFARRFTPGRMPTADELIAEGESSLANAVAAHGGFPAMAKSLGLKPRNVRAQGAKVRWDEEKLGLELRKFTEEFFPDLWKGNLLPTERMLRKHGRNDLSYAVCRFGGFKKVQQQFGFACKRKGPFSSRPLASA